ncbi:MAG: mycolyltransferase [Mycobacterium sp.]|nr:mycolyltransferase [Mycobacterium sp.]
MVAGAPTSINVPGVGDVKLDGPTADAYTKAGGEAALGAPTGQPQKVGDGTVQAFAKGTIFDSPATGAHLVQGEILREYTEKGGAGGELGFPTTDESQTAGGPDVAKGGWIGEFQKGTITWLNQGDGTFKATITPKQ